MINRYFILGLSVFISVASYSQTGNKKNASDLQLNTITTAVPFLQITPDSRSGAMGDVGTALSASSSSLFWNTSMLSFSKDKSEISVSYSPWLQNLASDIHLSHLAGYYKINGRHSIGASLRYFSLGEIVFTDDKGDEIMSHTPTEFEVLAGYAFKLNNNFSLGLNGKFIYSNLTAGVVIAGAESTPGLAGAADLSFSYNNTEINYGKLPGGIAVGLTLNNIGNKISYTVENDRDFLPTNLKLGTALNFKFDSYNSLTWATDISKLLVPTPPIRNNKGEIISGKNPEVGVVTGMLHSFYDAPGALEKDEAGNLIQADDGSYRVKKGSKFKEEINEIMIGTGLEYWYNNLFAVRAGYFYENRNKGARQHLTFGVGLRYKIFGIDFSYLTALKRNNPLQNTIRFTLRLHFNGVKKDVSKEPVVD
ncbi:MAG: type IX secretion system outer membrane channel protein PorV [Brumimicrobium sp.]|nr:type IX secretion system outer membrane channel protein PorV [Brumimicrobium sp.]MCO5268309.1 type IX secretion system outer membrane channel protein PorV [Brumimicrobium sp.]